MPSIKTKQVAGVTLIVGLAVVLLSGWYISSLAKVWLEETRARAELLANAITHRAFDVLLTGGGDPLELLGRDDGLKSILQASAYSENVLYAEIVDTQERIVAHPDPLIIGSRATPADDISALLNEGPAAQASAIYAEGGRSFEYRRPLLIGDTEFGSVRVGISTLLLRRELNQQLRTPLATAALAIVLASLVAMLLAQVALRPIHVVRSGLARLGRGEIDVNVDLKGDADLAELGDSFKAVSARLAADRTELASQRATLESVVENLEDAVALFDQQGCLLFANPAMRTVLGDASGPVDRFLPQGHPFRTAVASVLEGHQSLESTTVDVPGVGKRLVLAHLVEDADGRALGAMLVARNLAYLNQVESTLNYSRKLAALGRLSAGIAHEVKNPLNATMIHLELLKMQVADMPAALEHVTVIGAQVRRLDEVVQGFLRFTRPEELQLQPVQLAPLFDGIMPVIAAEASKSHVEVRLDVPASLPAISGDSGLLQQAFLNLALNACQAMPTGGRLRIGARIGAPHDVEIAFEDTGVGIAPDHLARIFDLYFTTKEHGSGIGLSLVYRTVQLHDGHIEVQSVPGHGTTFRLRFRVAPVAAPRALPPTGTLGLRTVESV
ncbi:MAG: PAS domain-containing protein [Acidobacteria bacterium]|nr:PAS domain-containing protein [Acidobacteriota bacterium]